LKGEYAKLTVFKVYEYVCKSDERSNVVRKAFPKKKKKRGRNSLTTPDLSSVLQKGTQTLKSINLEYQSFNFNSPLEFSVKSCQNFQNTPLFFFFGKKNEQNIARI
jgi:hypothetical protein